MYDTAKIFNALISVLFNYMLYAYLEKLEKIGCECSNPTQRDVIKGMIIMNYVLIFGAIFVSPIPNSTAVMASIMSTVFGVLTFMYLYKLKRDKCKCSKDMIREIYYYYYFIVFLLYGMLVSMLILIILSTLLSDSFNMIKNISK